MANITHPEMVAALVKPGAAILDTLDPAKVDLLHMVVGVAGEAGEILECYERSTVGSLDRVNMVEELGDIEFYLEGVRQNLGIAYHETTNGQVPARGVVIEEAVAAVTTRALMLLDVTKKVVIYNKPINRAVFVERLQWIEVWLHVLRTITGITRDETLTANIAKLSVRYEGLRYSDAAAQARADKAPGE